MCSGAILAPRCSLVFPLIQGKSWLSSRVVLAKHSVCVHGVVCMFKRRLFFAMTALECPQRHWSSAAQQHGGAAIASACADPAAEAAAYRRRWRPTKMLYPMAGLRL